MEVESEQQQLLLQSKKRLSPGDDNGCDEISTLGFFHDFEVNADLWVVHDRVSQMGFIFGHVATSRLMAVINTVDRESEQHNGYSVRFQITDDYVEETAILRGDKSSISLLLDKIDATYNHLGPWIFQEGADADVEVQSTVLQEAFDTRYSLFLEAMDMIPYQVQERKKAIKVKRNK